ncbi:hypothetical protein FGHELIBC_00017 [Camelpox virus]|uniref:Uncharacterized protein n=1 Tax=Camelpox virus TaxID=28873 RepID=A0A4Y5MY56_9POXV|nr:hypothetical protein FGHELIBC_00017 [Camelpox virus]
MIPKILNTKSYYKYVDDTTHNLLCILGRCNRYINSITPADNYRSVFVVTNIPYNV